MWLLRIRRLAREIGREALVLVFAIRDPATPVALKAASVAMLAYLFSPIDLVPDVPIVGWVDDLLLISVGMPYLIRRLPPAVYLRASAKADRLLASLGIEPASKPVAPVSGTPRAAGAKRKASGARDASGERTESGKRAASGMRASSGKGAASGKRAASGKQAASGKGASSGKGAASSDGSARPKGVAAVRRPRRDA
jgi:uncharacterized membrane protein YkvA (DUF1232 family)